MSWAPSGPPSHADFPVELPDRGELPLDFSVGDDEFNRARILKGVQTRLENARPQLFDLFVINSGLLGAYFPLLCASYILVDVDAVQKFFKIPSPRVLEESELVDTKAQCEVFLSTGDPYWRHLLVVIDSALAPQAPELLVPFNADIASYVDSVSLDDLDSSLATLESQFEDDLPEFQPFYVQLIARLRLILSTSWFDRFHNDLLKRVTKQLPVRELKSGAAAEAPILTKAQRKYKTRMLQQPNGAQNLFAVVRQFFSAKNVQRPEVLRVVRVPANSLEDQHYWGDEEVGFDDRIEVPVKNVRGRVLPQYEAISYLGIDWNAYNRAKYDEDHPPPKTIRGYRFRIFYPNTADKTRAPTFVLDKNLIDPKATPPDPRYTYTTIVFEAGDPYLPIAFRIIDKQWDTYRNDGYISSFRNGVFTFQFAFKASLYHQGYQPKQLY